MDHVDDQSSFPHPKSDGLTREQAMMLADAVSETENFALAVSAFETEDGTWAIEATCDAPPDAEIFNKIAADVLGGELDIIIGEIDPETDWVKKGQEGLAPVSAGGFYIHGAHDKANVPFGSKPIQIDAAQAFGTGHHGTTTGCLDAMADLLRTFSPQTCIDLGTGSGVLAIALAMKLRRKVMATDIDPVAVRIARENATLNNVGKFVQPFVATGLEHRSILQEAPFDLVVANILAKPLIQISADMADLTRAGSRAILSGLLTTQIQSVLSAYNNTGFVLEKTYRRGDWAALLLKRG